MPVNRFDQHVGQLDHTPKKWTIISSRTECTSPPAMQASADCYHICLYSTDADDSCPKIECNRPENLSILSPFFSVQPADIGTNINERRHIPNGQSRIQFGDQEQRAIIITVARAVRACERCRAFRIIANWLGMVCRKLAFFFVCVCVCSFVVCGLPLETAVAAVRKCPPCRFFRLVLYTSSWRGVIYDSGVYSELRPLLIDTRI